MDDPILASYPPPGAVATKKELSHLDEHCASFVAMSPFVVVSTASASGAPDVSPRGGPPGFVRQVDDHTLLLPDRLGNNRLDSLRKIAENPRVALLFMVPGINDTLRVFGTAHLATTDQLATDLTERGRQPESVLVITVELAFVHCAKALMRGRLWEPESYTPRNGVAHGRRGLPSPHQHRRTRRRRRHDAEPLPRRALRRARDVEYRERAAAPLSGHRGGARRATAQEECEG